jgi:hypothetical protein
MKFPAQAAWVPTFAKTKTAKVSHPRVVFTAVPGSAPSPALPLAFLLLLLPL